MAPRIASAAEFISNRPGLTVNLIGKTMVLECAELKAKEGTREEFLAALRGKGAALLRGIPGCLDVRVGGGVENPDKILLLVDWESLEAHSEFKKMPEYVELAKIFGPFAAGGAVEHFEMG